VVCHGLPQILPWILPLDLLLFKVLKVFITFTSYFFYATGTYRRYYATPATTPSALHQHSDTEISDRKLKTNMRAPIIYFANIGQSWGTNLFGIERNIRPK